MAYEIVATLSAIYKFVNRQLVDNKSREKQ